MINYYGTDADYIHAKFGDLRKMYNFTDSFKHKYPKFCEEYTKYWNGEYSAFKQPQQIVEYVEQNNIPVHFYFNYTDEPASIPDMKEYFKRELATPKNLEEALV